MSKKGLLEGAKPHSLGGPEEEGKHFRSLAKPQNSAGYPPKSVSFGPEEEEGEGRGRLSPCAHWHEQGGSKRQKGPRDNSPMERRASE